MTTTESYGCDKHGEDAYQGCAMCDLETLRERLHEAELVAASWKREAELNEQAADESSGYAKRLAEADKANQLLRTDIAAQSREEDLILMALHLDPERYRTECGYLNVPKIIAAIKNPDMYSRTADSATPREDGSHG